MENYWNGSGGTSNGWSPSQRKLFGPGGSISEPRQLLDAWGDPIRRDSPDHGFVLPHNITFASILSTGYKAYLHGQHDEAVKHNREDAIAMKNDCFLQALMNERKYGTVNLNWHIEVDDERDKMEVAVRDTLTRVIRQIPRIRRFFSYMLEAIWYGRYGSELVWDWGVGKFPSAKQYRLGQQDEMRYLRVKSHQPINGDKIGHAWDGTPYILVNAAYDKRLPNAEIHPTSAGADGLYLRGHWRNHFCIHTHDSVDMDYFDPMGADAVHGFGIRSTLFWLNWIRLEWLGNIADWCERTGLGIRLWYYQANNPASEAAVKQAARDSNDRTNIFIPRYGQGGPGVEGVEYVDTSGSGAQLLLELQKHVEEQEERFVVGQSMSSGRDANDGLGGSGRAAFARDTKASIIAYDASGLGETLTNDLVKPIQYWTFKNNPAAQKVNARFVFSVDEPEPEKLMNAIKTFVVELGGSVREDGVRTQLGKGFDKPQDGDEIIDMESINKQKQAGMPQGGGMPGMPGMPPGAPPGLPPQDESAAAEPPAEEEAVGPPGSEDIQAKVDELVARMEKMQQQHEELLRYQSAAVASEWVDIPQKSVLDSFIPSIADAADKNDDQIITEYERLFEGIL